MTFCSSWKNYVSLETFGALPEGQLFFKDEPILEVIAPYY
jgi:hypothetical protein